MTTEERITKMRSTLFRAYLQFKTYADLHAAKGTPEGTRKAAENLRMSNDCLEAYNA